jgi:tetratricopeptide (TPR) repeat protein
MKSPCLKASLLVAALLALSSYLPASEGSPLLLVPEGARSSALAGAFSMETGSAETLWYNPAGVAGMDSTEIGFSHAAWIGGTSLEYLSAAWGNRTLGLGAYAQYASAQDLARDSTGQALGSFGLQNINAGLAAAGRMDWLRFGLAGKLLEQGVAGQQADGFAGDLGLQADLMGGRLRLGAAAQNLGSEQDPGFGGGAVQTPFTLRAGAALDLPAGFKALGEYRRYVALGQDSFAGGLEYSLSVAGARTAWRFGWESDLGAGDPAGLTAGVGLGLASFTLDYAFQSLGDLGPVQRITLSWRLPSGTAPVPTGSAEAGAPGNAARQGAPASATAGRGGPAAGGKAAVPELPQATAAQRGTKAQRAREAFDAGRYQECAALYTQLSETGDDRQSSRLLSSAALAWNKLGDRTRALACFKAAYAKDPGRAVLKQWIRSLENSK